MINFEPMTADPVPLRQAFACFPSGVTSVGAVVDGAPVGMAASSFTSVSLDPPLVSVCFQNSSTTWPRLREHGRLGISVLAEGHDEICRAISSRSPDRFEDIEWDVSPGGGLFVHDAAAWLDVVFDSEVPAGDHTIALLSIDGLQINSDTAPLVFHGSRFRRLATL
ncbi:oxidoreductase [Gordonia spumicola]|uniref:Oxidoreductase n=1 Tax=Gordonia spumicola TaxID=589161 RepID=A0A7I9V9A1_9ACTN|nr:flavin reductase family protein [Gordonia spumicola]GEE01681.1 oxidoreductase [Gordonia spumicola]